MEEEKDELLIDLLTKSMKKINIAAVELTERYRDSETTGKKDLAPYDFVFLRNLDEAITKAIKDISECTGINRNKVKDLVAKGLGIRNLPNLLNSCNTYFYKIKNSKNIGEVLEASKELFQILMQMSFICAGLELRKKF